MSDEAMANGRAMAKQGIADLGLTPIDDRSQADLDERSVLNNNFMDVIFESDGKAVDQMRVMREVKHLGGG